MTRPLRIDIANGWYHITSRGQNRQRIYADVADRKDFLARLEEMTKRFDLELHAYVLMPNHYHLLIRTPNANASPAMQWLNNGYGMWRNRRHGLTGHVFQGRFKGILVEQSAWLLSLSQYLHFNPVAVKSLGMDKRSKKVESLGAFAPSVDIVKRRLEVLRTYRWSSYRPYAGYEATPAWLSTRIITEMAGGQATYRDAAENRLRQGQQEDVWQALRWRVILGSRAFAEKMSQGTEVFRETQGRSALRRRASWSEIVKAVEYAKGERWSSFVNRHGDWGRDMALWIGHRRSGLRLRELGESVGGLDYSAVSEAIRTFERKRLPDPVAKKALKSACQYLNMET
jgi:REP element-mobilizing transposase RayT